MAVQCPMVVQCSMVCITLVDDDGDDDDDDDDGIYRQEKP